jgi:hypothetical protein
MTYNQYLSKGIRDGSIPHKVVDGVKIYLVRRPKDDEVVQEYINFSENFISETPTQRARREATS